MAPRTYRGPVLDRLLLDAQADFNGEAVVLETREERDAQGRRIFELVASDSAGVVRAERRAAALRDAEAPPTELVRAPGRGRTADLLAFVGPTGAGKTTMVAKLAGHPTIFGHRQVGLLSLDTFRVGAVEQLAAYAALGRRPIEVAYEPDDLPRALKRLAGCDVVLVDCPGRSPRQAHDTDAVREMLRRLRPTEVHGVLPAGLRTEHAKRIVEGLFRLGLTHLCASKLDEYPDDWALFDLAAQLALPMRWLGDGQSVPQDVRSAAARLDNARGQLATRRRRYAQDVVA